MLNIYNFYLDLHLQYPKDVANAIFDIWLDYWFSIGDKYHFLSLFKN